jgi:hypothetical protein
MINIWILEEATEKYEEFHVRYEVLTDVTMKSTIMWDVFWIKGLAQKYLLLVESTIWPWRWRQYVPPKHWKTSTRLYRIISIWGGLAYLWVIEGDKKGTSCLRAQLGHRVTGGHKYIDLVFQVGGWTQDRWPCSVQKITVAKSKEVKTRLSNSRRNKQVWKNLLRQVVAQKGALCRQWW